MCLMKVLTVVVPAYNAQDYLEKCIRSILPAGDKVEIIIVDDGSADRTGEIADRFALEYPQIVRTVHQENAGHGGAVNTGIQHAKGRYIKVVDSDDWVNSDVLSDIVTKLEEFIEENSQVDMLLSNFIYDKVGATNKRIMDYKGTIPVDEVITWNDILSFPVNKYILMHSVIYSVDVLKKCGLELPKHTFYVDNLFVYLPLPHVNYLYYMDTCLYHYFIGREEQSVNERNMIRNIDQQLRVNRMMIESVDLSAVSEAGKRKYMRHYLTLVTSVSSVLLYKKGDKEAMAMKHIFWRHIRSTDFGLYLRMRFSLLGTLFHIPGKVGKGMTLLVYKLLKKRIGFN